MDRASLIHSFIHTAAYYPCLLLVDLDIVQLDEAAATLVRDYGWPQVKIGQALSAHLLNNSLQRRSQAVQQWLEVTARTTESTILLLSNIDLLFEPSLALDPLTLFKKLSRIKPLVVLWPGTIRQGTLAYAVETHQHYRTWQQTDLLTQFVQPLC